MSLFIHPRRSALPSLLSACVLGLAALSATAQTPGAAMQPAGKAVTGAAPKTAMSNPSGFNADVAGFHVKLENGSANYAGDTATLTGTVSVWHKSDPSQKLTWRNANVTAKKNGNAWNSVNGSGSFDVATNGATIAISNGSFQSNPAGTQITGTGKLQRFGHNFTMSFALLDGADGTNFSASSAWNATGRGWQTVPGVDPVEYRVSNPSLQLNVKGTAVTATFDVNKVEVQTKAKNAGGQPWARAEVNPDPVTVGVDGKVDLRLPGLGQPEDPNKSARDACVNTAHTVANDAKKVRGSDARTINDIRDQAVNACNGNYPTPPSVPTLPGTIRVEVTVVIA